jgi:hypothetical protein
MSKMIQKDEVVKGKRITFSIGFLILQIFQELSRPSGVVLGFGGGYDRGTDHLHRRGSSSGDHR